MPKVEFTSANVKKNPFDFPKLKLKKGEYARLVLLEDPVAEYVHDLRAPKLTNGIPTKETKQRADGTSYTDFVMEFISRPICLGDWDTLEERSSDPVHCPMCKLAKDTDFASQPKRRFAFHVYKYATKAGSGEISKPYGGSVVVWSFTDKVFTKLFDLKNEWGDLTQHDLILKCDNEMFQNYELSVAAKAEWLADAGRQAATKEAFESNKAEDLALFCGSKKDRKWVDEDVQRVVTVWNQALGTNVGGTAGVASTVGSLTEGLGLLNEGSTVQRASEPKSGAVESFDSILTPTVTQDSWLDPAAAEAADAAEEAAAKTIDVPAANPTAEKADDLDSILADL